MIFFKKIRDEIKIRKNKKTGIILLIASIYIFLSTEAIIPAVQAEGISNLVEQTQVSNGNWSVEVIDVKERGGGNLVITIKVVNKQNNQINKFQVETLIRNLEKLSLYKSKLSILGNVGGGSMIILADLEKGEKIAEHTGFYFRFSDSNRYLVGNRFYPRHSRAKKSVLMLLDLKTGKFIPIYPQENYLTASSNPIDTSPVTTIHSVKDWSSNEKFLAIFTLTKRERRIVLIDLTTGLDNIKFQKINFRKDNFNIDKIDWRNFVPKSMEINNSGVVMLETKSEEYIYVVFCNKERNHE